MFSLITAETLGSDIYATLLCNCVFTYRSSSLIINTEKDLIKDRNLPVSPRQKHLPERLMLL